MKDRLSVIERIIFLKQVPLFKGMSAEQLKVLANICEEQFYARGEVIFREGDPSGDVYVVVNGRVAIERQAEGTLIRLATLEARSTLGEMNLFKNNPRNASALAVEETLLLKLRAEPFVALIRQNPDISIELINVLSLRLSEANDQIAHLIRATQENKPRLVSMPGFGAD
jgi:CRP-like cAMP-binding protein